MQAEGPKGAVSEENGQDARKPKIKQDLDLDRPGKIMVTGIPKEESYSERDLEKEFAPYGRITEVVIIRDRRTTIPRGFAFITYENPQDAGDAIKFMEGKNLGGDSPIHCEQAVIGPRRGKMMTYESRGGPRGRGLRGRGGSDRGLDRGRGGPMMRGMRGDRGRGGPGGPPGRGFEEMGYPEEEYVEEYYEPEMGFGRGGERGYGRGGERGYGRGGERGYGRGGERGYGRGGERGYGRGGEREYGGGDKAFGRGGERGFGRGERGFGRGERGYGRGEYGYGRGEPGYGGEDMGYDRGESGYGPGDPGLGRGFPPRGGPSGRTGRRALLPSPVLRGGGPPRPPRGGPPEEYFGEESEYPVEGREQSRARPPREEQYYNETYGEQYAEEQEYSAQGDYYAGEGRPPARGRGGMQGGNGWAGGHQMQEEGPHGHRPRPPREQHFDEYGYPVGDQDAGAQMRHPEGRPSRGLGSKRAPPSAGRGYQENPYEEESGATPMADAYGRGRGGPRGRGHGLMRGNGASQDWRRAGLLGAEPYRAEEDGYYESPGAPQAQPAPAETQRGYEESSYSDPYGHRYVTGRPAASATQDSMSSNRRAAAGPQASRYPEEYQNSGPIAAQARDVAAYSEVRRQASRRPETEYRRKEDAYTAVNLDSYASYSSSGHEPEERTPSEMFSRKRSMDYYAEAGDMRRGATLSRQEHEDYRQQRPSTQSRYSSPPSKRERHDRSEYESYSRQEDVYRGL